MPRNQALSFVLSQHLIVSSTSLTQSVRYQDLSSKHPTKCHPFTNCGIRKQRVEFCRVDIVEAEKTPADSTDNKNENYGLEEDSADITTYNSGYENDTNSVHADGVDLEAGSDETTVGGHEQSKPPDAVEIDHNIGTMIDGVYAGLLQDIRILQQLKELARLEYKLAKLERMLARLERVLTRVKRRLAGLKRILADKRMLMNMGRLLC